MNNTNTTNFDLSNSTIGDNNSFNNSINITYNFTVNIDQRGNLKSKHDGQVYKFTMYCVDEVDYVYEDGYVFAICINAFSNYEFISDHVHVKFPKSKFCDYHKQRVITIYGKVYDYERGNETRDYGIEVIDILDIKERLGVINVNIPLNKKHTDHFEELMEGVTRDRLCEIVERQLTVIDALISQETLVNPGFVSGFIMTRYFLNSQLQSLVNQRTALQFASKECLIDLFKLISYVYFMAEDRALLTWKNVFGKINMVCNYFQGVYKPFEERDKKEEKEINKNLKEFGKKIGIEKHKKVSHMNNLFNKNLGFTYDNNIPLLEKELKDACISYLLAKGFLKEDK